MVKRITKQEYQLPAVEPIHVCVNVVAIKIKTWRQINFAILEVSSSDTHFKLIEG